MFPSGSAGVFPIISARGPGSTPSRSRDRMPRSHSSLKEVTPDVSSWWRFSQYPLEWTRSYWSEQTWRYTSFGSILHIAAVFCFDHLKSCLMPRNLTRRQETLFDWNIGVFGVWSSVLHCILVTASLWLHLSGLSAGCRPCTMQHSRRARATRATRATVRPPQQCQNHYW